jgi:hemolysin D
MSGLVPARRGFLTLLPRDEREFLPAALEIIETPASPAGRATALVICAAVLTAITWAALAKIDIVTSATGRIVLEGRSKTVQPFAAGIVERIAVADGDHVAAGQVLVVLDPTSAQADEVKDADALLDAELDRARLEGLRAVLTTGAAPVLMDVPASANAAQIAAANAQMQAQALEEMGKLSDIDQQIAEKNFEAAQAVATIAKVQTDQPFLQQIAGMRTQLLHEQVGSRLDWLNAEEQLADTGPDIAQAKAQQSAALANVASLRQQRAQTQADYAKTVLSDLETADEKISDATGDLAKARQALALTTLSAPISGTVQQLAVHTIGGVVSPAQALLTIVPDNERLLVEASVKNQDVGFVRVGQVAEVKVGAFDFTRFGSISGQVVSISHDVIDNAPNQAPQNDGYATGADPVPDATPQNGALPAPQEPAYVVHIALSRTTINTDSGPADLLPGMAVTADVKTGRRSVLSYLLAPLAHQVEEAGHER